MAFDRLQGELDARRRQSLYRSRRLLQSPQGPEILLDGKPSLSFCSNDYLGLANDPRLKSTMTQAITEAGVGGGASHLVNGHHQYHHDLELALAEFLQVERVLCFSTGYMANLGAINGLLRKQDQVFEDRLNHASLLDAGLLSGARFQRYLHNDVENLKRKIEKAYSPDTDRLVVTDGVFSMDGDIAPLPELLALCREKDAWLMVDDAHGLGVIGEQGRGTASAAGLAPSDIDITMGTLGKALGSFGAFVAGSEVLIETLIQQARPYIYTTAMPPAVAAATRESLRIVETEEWRRDHLSELISVFREGCETLGLDLMPSITPIQPIVIGGAAEALKWSQQLEAQGIVVTAIRPPTVAAGSSRLRVTLSASHTKTHVDRLIAALKQCQDEVPLTEVPLNAQ